MDTVISTIKKGFTVKNIVELVYDFIRGLEMRKLNYQIEKTKLFSSKYKIALLGVLWIT